MIGRTAAVTVGVMLLCSGTSGGAGAASDGKIKKELFQTSDRCFACHNALSHFAGEDISIGIGWRATMMANSARDPYWQAGVRRETIDHPRVEGRDRGRVLEMPHADGALPGAVRRTRRRGFSHLTIGSDDRMDRLAQDGVSCSLCHQISREKLGTPESLVGGFVIDTARAVGEREEYGPFKIENGETRIMRTSSGGYRPTEGEHVRQSEFAPPATRSSPRRSVPMAGKSARFLNRCPTRNGSRATSATSRAARTATCRSSRSRCGSPACSASSAKACRAIRSSAAISSCSGC